MEGRECHSLANFNHFKFHNQFLKNFVENRKIHVLHFSNFRFHNF